MQTQAEKLQDDKIFFYTFYLATCSIFVYEIFYQLPFDKQSYTVNSETISRFLMQKRGLGEIPNTGTLLGKIHHGVSSFENVSDDPTSQLTWLI